MIIDPIEIYKKQTSQPDLTDDGASKFIAYDGSMGTEAFLDGLTAHIEEEKKAVGNNVVVLTDYRYYSNNKPYRGYLGKIRGISVNKISNPYSNEHVCEYTHGIPIGYELRYRISICRIREHDVVLDTDIIYHYDDLFMVPDDAIILPYHHKAEYRDFISDNNVDVKYFDSYKKRTTVAMFQEPADLVHFKLVFDQLEF